MVPRFAETCAVEEQVEQHVALLDMLASDGDELLDVKQVAKVLRVDPTTVRRWIKQGTLPAISFPEKKVGRQRQMHRIRKATLLKIVGHVHR